MEKLEPSYEVAKMPPMHQPGLDVDINGHVHGDALKMNLTEEERQGILAWAASEQGAVAIRDAFNGVLSAFERFARQMGELAAEMELRRGFLPAGVTLLKHKWPTWFLNMPERAEFERRGYYRLPRKLKKRLKAMAV